MDTLGYISAGLTMLAGVIHTLELKGKVVRFLLAAILVATGMISLFTHRDTTTARNEAVDVVQSADVAIKGLAGAAEASKELVGEITDAAPAARRPELVERVRETDRKTDAAVTDARSLEPRITDLLRKYKR